MKFTGSFGEWLKQRRKALDLTQRDLADQVGCAEVTIRKIEGNANRPSRQIAERLADVLAIAPDEQAAFVSFARRLADQPPALPVELASQHPAHNLPPQLTPFIGRESEQVQIAEYLADPICRLLTLLGPGGIGKTRLALQATTDCIEKFADGVFFVPLTPVGSASLIAAAIASALDISFYSKDDPAVQIVNYLRGKRILLLMDNYEHLLDGVGLLSDILSNAPRVKIVVTSRERLNLQEEWALPIEGLSFPMQETNANLESYDAVQLFVQSARRVQSGFSLVDNQSGVVDICRAVEGLPLAIELAATWLKVIPCQQIAGQIRRDLDFLATPLRNVPERHRNMRAVFDHSWSLLSSVERDVLMKLSVFRGNCNPEAAQRVAGATLPILAGLVDKSLLRRNPAGRYDLHELVRQYAEQRLQQSSDLDTARSVHSAYFTQFIYQRLPDIKGRRQIAALDEIEADFANIRAAWDHILSQKNLKAMDQMLECLSLFCDMRADPHEGADLFRPAIEAIGGERSQEARRVLGRLQARYAGMIMWGDLYAEKVGELLRTSMAIAQSNQDQAEIAFCLLLTGLSRNRPDYDPSSVPFFEESFQRYSEINDPYHVGQLHELLGHLHEAIKLHRQTGNIHGLASALNGLAAMNFFDCHFVEADHFAQEALIVLYEKRDPYGTANIMTWRAIIAMRSGAFEQARVLNAEALKRTTTLNIGWAKACCLTTESFLTSIMEEDYVSAKQFDDEAIPLAKKVMLSHQFMSHMAAALSAYGLGDYQTARDQYREAFMQRIGPWVKYVPALYLSAMLLVQEGKNEHAVEFLSLADNHPNIPEAWRKGWALPNRVCSELQNELPPDIYATAWERGKTLQVEAAVKEIL